MAGPLETYRIQADDYYHFGASRTWDRMTSNLVRPHNLHVVAVFRFFNWCLLRLSGDWQDLPRVAGVAAYVLLALAMVLCGWFVWGETGNPAIGLASMVGLGGSTLLYSAVTFYAATPALWAGLGMLLTLLALQRWRRVGSSIPLVAAGLASLLAIASWSGGYVVVPVAAIYLWADRRPRCRRAGVIFLLAAGIGSVGLVALTRQSILAAHNLGGRAAGEALRPIRGAIHTIHAIPESLVLRNLGIEAEITESQAVVFCLVLLGLWIGLRRRVSASPIEAAGATCVLVSYLLIYTARGYLPFSSLRTTPWYQTLPHFGAVLFVSGVFSRAASSAMVCRPLTAGGILAATAFSVLFCAVQKPVANRLFRDEIFPALRGMEPEGLALPEKLLNDLTWEVARLVAQEQRRLFGQFDRTESVSRQLGISPSGLRDEFGTPRFPSVPAELDPWSILDLAPEPGAAGPELVRQSLGWIRQEQPLPHLALRPLLESLQDEDPQTRTGAAIALGLLGSQAEPAVPALLNLLHDPDPRIRTYSAMALRRIDPRSAEKLGLE
jgi:hypothetical protein